MHDDIAADLLSALQALIAEYEPNMKTFALNAPRRAIWENAIAVVARAQISNNHS